MTKILCALLAIALAGCSTAIQISTEDAYKAAHPGDVSIPSTAIRFSLQDSAITLSTAAKGKADDGTNATTVGNPKSTAASNPPQQTINTCKDNNWWTCFNQVTVSAAMAPSPKAKVYVAAADDSSHLWLTSTSLSGSPVTGQDTLYTTITIKYTSNTATVISAAGAGAVSGFGLAGPAGAGAGALLGAVGTLAPAPVNNPPDQPVQSSDLAPLVNPYVCSGGPLNFQQVTDALAPQLSLPLTIAAADARPVVAAKQANEVDLPTKDDASSCWHVLPNTSGLATISTTTLDGKPAGTTQRVPGPGDGWLYRIVAKSELPPGLTDAATFLADTSTKSEFPYSSCRAVTLQVMWWKALVSAIQDAAKAGKNGLPEPEVVTFDTVVADPDHVNVALVTKGGVVNFKPDCGANVTANTDTGNGAILNAVVTQVQNIYKAEQSYDAAKKTTTK